MSSPRVSIWAVCCGAAGLTCASVAAIAVIVALLPTRWVGHPYLVLVERLHPGVDAPDNWALAFTYLVHLVCGLAGLAVVLLLIANPRFWIRALTRKAS